MPMRSKNIKPKKMAITLMLKIMKLILSGMFLTNILNNFQNTKIMIAHTISIVASPNTISDQKPIIILCLWNYLQI